MSTDWPVLIRKLQRDAEMPERKLARDSGLDRNTLRKFYNGTSSLKINQIEILLDVFGYELEAFRKQERA